MRTALTVCQPHFVAERVERGSLGAWLVRWNPRVWDLEQYWKDARGGPIEHWSVGDNYRSRLMERGDRILLWVGGQSCNYERGIWGSGLVTGEPMYDVPLSNQAISPYWRDRSAGEQHRHFARVRITPLVNTAVTDATLRQHGVTDLEVQRQPQGISPSWVTREQMVRIDEVTRTQPDPATALAQAGGGRFEPATENQRVEQAAIKAVTAYYKGAGWTVRDVSMAKVGWDLSCTKGSEIARVEVKGIRSVRPIVFLTANEIRAAEEVNHWYVAVVTRALDNPSVTEYSAQAALAAAVPYAYRANLQLTPETDGSAEQ